MINIIVTAPPESIQHLLALEFVECSVRKGHSANVFFYSDAVTVAKAESQISHQLRWAALQTTPKHLCIGAAETRNLNSSNINATFRLSGLGELAEMLMQPNIIHFKS
jgi:sulfur relay (sulfurtransferase) complex TusBCD TusD component (DsrE family)